MTRSRSNSISDSDSDSGGLAAMMQEPESFRPQTPPPSVVPFKRAKFKTPIHNGPETIQVRLLSGHPLWGHILYPAAKALSNFIELHRHDLLRPNTLSQSPKQEKGKGRPSNVLELGAGGGLPGLVAALEGAGNVVISDFPDADLVGNIAINIDENIGQLGGKEGIANTVAKGFTWGSPPGPLLSEIPNGQLFDLILLSDLVFNHSQHAALIDTCLSCLSSPSPSSSPSLSPSSSSPTPPLPPADLTTPSLDLTQPLILCFYSHHRPTKELIAADVGILEMAKSKGLKVVKVWEDTEAGPAFPEDKGDLSIRSTVHGWAFYR
ncbi:hypothetical protein T439DRAFT_307900 [Meredithblackwellia eburnea MCA 4105]